MNQLSDFLSPVDPDLIQHKGEYYTSHIRSFLSVYETDFPSLEEIDIAFIGVCDDRLSVNNEGCSMAPDKIREQLYRLNTGDFTLRMADLGNIRAGATPRDTQFALKTVVAELMKINVLPLIIGGGQELTYGQYWAYEALEQKVELVAIDSHFDLDSKDEEQAMPDSSSYLNKIILHEPNYLFNYSNIGYQTYLVNQDSIRLMHKLYFDIHRLGEFNAKIQETEPVIRAADMLSVDISAIRMSDAPGNANANPNGFYGEELCQMMRYAGMSDKLSSIGIYEMNPKYDRQGQTAALVAQMIWCFIEGYYLRKNDIPTTSKKDFIKYRATFGDVQHEVVFFKSKRSGRWWMQIPYPNTISKNERFHLVPCSYEDYRSASKGEIPDRWWRNFQKLI